MTIKVGVDDWHVQNPGANIGELVTKEFRKYEGPDLTTIAGFELNDDGNADRFIAQYGEELRYVTQQERWLHWDGKCWVDAESPTEYARDLRKRMLELGRGLKNPDQQKAFMRWVHQSGGERHLAAMTRIAKDVKPIRIDVTELDRHDYYLNTREGPLNLKTGEIMDPDPGFMLTQIANVEYDPKSGYDDWREFLWEATNHSDELIRFLQESAGYWLTGMTKWAYFWYLLGPTRTGKTTFTQTLLDVMGDYGIALPFSSFLTVTRAEGGDKPRPDIMAMRNKRMFVSGEVNRGQRFDVAFINQLTGEDRISARALYSNTMTQTKMKGKMVLTANHLPKVPEDDDAFWGRGLIIGFENMTFSDEKWLPLKQLVRSPEMRSGILNWMIEGLRISETHGGDLNVDSVLESNREIQERERAKREESRPFVIPEVVLRYGIEIRAESDTVQQFIDDKCELMDHFKVTFRELWEEYQRMFRKESDRLGRTQFRNALVKKGFTVDMEDKYRNVYGLRIRDPSEEEYDIA